MTKLYREFAGNPSVVLTYHKFILVQCFMKKKLNLFAYCLLDPTKSYIVQNCFYCLLDPAKNYIIQNCGNNTFNTGQHYIVDGDYGTYNTHGFCRVIIPTLVNTNDGYQITVWLYNTIGPRGINSGHLGLAFNVKDEFNFDFVYLR